MRRAAPALHLAPTLLLLGLAGLQPPPAAAQNLGLVVRDGTLGTGPLEIGGTDPGSYLITPEMGQQSGSNLFHSFLRFSIGTNETATFTGPDGIDNVISRVTGGYTSQIDGTLRSTIPGADVWLLNPRGVVFGAGAKLEVPASFHVATADYLGFDGGLERFYADPTLPSVLATAPPAAFGFLAESAGASASIAVDNSHLAVDPGETLELAGGDVSLTLNAALVAPGGDVRLEAQGEVLISQSLVDVGRTGETPGTISIRGGKIVVEKSSLVRAENESVVSPSAADAEQPGPGAIAIAASESVLVDASLLSVSTHGAGNAGTIDIASPQVTLRNGLGFDPVAPPQETLAGARVETTSSGRGGEIRIRAEKLVTLANGIGVSASAVGPEVSGDAGTVQIVAPQVNATRDSYVTAETAGAGEGGTISIDAGESLLVDDSLLSVNTSGDGNAGTIDIASPVVTFQNGPGTSTWAQQAIEVGARAETASSGAGGDIHIDADELTIRNGTAVSARTVGPDATGSAGTIQIRANDLRVDGAQGRSGISAASAGSSGAPGKIDVVAGSIELLNLASIDVNCAACSSKAVDRRASDATVEITADSLVLQGSGGTTDFHPSVGAQSFDGDGDAGTVILHTHSLQLLDGGAILAHAGRGHGNNSGQIEIDADSIFMSGASRWHSAITVGNEGIFSGNAGTIDIRTRTLEIARGAGIDAAAVTGNAGTITIDADWVRIGDLGRPADDDPQGQPKIIASSFGAGDAGIIDITTRAIELEQGGVIYAAIAGSGKAGRIAITASESILVDGVGSVPATLFEILSRQKPAPAGIYAVRTGQLSEETGGAALGGIQLNAPEITITNGAIVSTASIGGSDASEIRLTGGEIHILNGAAVDSTSILDPRSFRHGGDAGHITLDAAKVIEIAGRHPSFPDVVSRVTSATLSEGDAGAVTLRAPRIVIDEGAVATTTVASVAPTQRVPRGGDITLDARFDGGQVVVRNGGQIDASTFVAGEPGQIEVTAGDSIVVEDSGRIESRTGGVGPGGNVALRAPRIEIARGGEVSAKSAPGLETVLKIFSGLLLDLVRLPTDDPSQVTGNAGSITLAASHLVHLDGGMITTDVGIAKGGDIAIDPDFVILEHGSRITSEATELTGQGGHIGITTDNLFLFPGSVISAQGRTPELSGTVEIHSPDVNVAGTIASLPSAFLDASSLMRERCAARRGGERAGSFAVRGAGGIPAEPDGWLPAPVLADTASIAAAPPATPEPFASRPGPLLASATCP